MPTSRTPKGVRTRRQGDPDVDDRSDAAADVGAAATAGAGGIDAQILATFKQLMKEQDERNAIRMERLENALRKEMTALVKPPPAIISVDDADVVMGPMVGAAAITRAGPLVKVPATMMLPPKLQFAQTLVSFDLWRASWNAYLETSGVRSIADDVAQMDRARSLLTQAFDSDLRSWVMSQEWYKDKTVNGSSELVLDRLRKKFEDEDDPYAAFSALMRRQWKEAESVDAFWLDIQSQVKYCGLKDAYHTNHVLRTLWSNNFGDDDTRKEISLHPKWTAAECYQAAKGLEQVRQRRSEGAQVSVVKSGYRRSKGGDAVKPSNAPGNAKKACLNCGFDYHRHGTCPAENATCKSCKAVGHYARHCTRTTADASTANATASPAAATATPFCANAVEIKPEIAATYLPSGAPECMKSYREGDYLGINVEVPEGNGRWSQGTIVGSVLQGRTRFCDMRMGGSEEIRQQKLDSLIIAQTRVNGTWVPSRNRL
jgi:hypothetical protein